MGIQCFFLDPTDRVRRSLRRYWGSYNGGDCSVNPYKYHDAQVPIGDGPLIIVTDADGGTSWRTEPMQWPHEDPRWPSACVCGYVFTEENEWQLRYEVIYKRRDKGEEVVWHEAGPGAMRYADWNLPHYAGADGHCVQVKTPGGDWLVDSRASNCTLPHDDKHRCWVRHGEVPNIHVDKNGLTCAAGAGSIQAGSYHGFLHNGVLT